MGNHDSGNLNRNVEAGVADGVVSVHVHHFGFEVSQFGFFVVAIGTNDDALTHVGQINACRRLAGNPPAKVNHFRGEISER